MLTTLLVPTAARARQRLQRHDQADGASRRRIPQAMTSDLELSVEENR
jgi:hypothetical protein